MTFGHPLWAFGLLIWLLVPILDRLAKPRREASLPLPHLGNRGLVRLSATLPWLSAHGVALVFLVLALAEPVWWRTGETRSRPGVAVVMVPGAALAADRLAEKRYDELLAHCQDRPILAITAGINGPEFVLPWTDHADMAAGLWPGMRPTVPTALDAAKAVLMASAKAPNGSWLVVIGGQAGGPGWRAAQATLQARHQVLALITAAPAVLSPRPACEFEIYDPDAIPALYYQLHQASYEESQPAEPWPLGRISLAAALVMLAANWLWRNRRWQVVGP